MWVVFSISTWSVTRVSLSTIISSSDKGTSIISSSNTASPSTVLSSVGIVCLICNSSRSTGTSTVLVSSITSLEISTFPKLRF